YWRTDPSCHVAVRSGVPTRDRDLCSLLLQQATQSGLSSPFVVAVQEHCSPPFWSPLPLERTGKGQAPSLQALVRGLSPLCCWQPRDLVSLEVVLLLPDPYEPVGSPVADR